MRQLRFQLPTWLWALIVFVVAVVPRTLALGNYLTPDEPNWVYRAVNFGSALTRGEWAATVQAGHPGVTTMWLGSLGIAIGRVVGPARTTEATTFLSKIEFLAPDNVEALKRIGVLLDWMRLPVIVLSALGGVAVFFLARRLLGQPVALLAAFLIALDPFLAGLGGLLHVDGLAATFSIVSVLALLCGLSPIAYRESPDSQSEFRNPKSPIVWFALSGVFAALAVLSKSPTLFLIPFTVLILVIAVLIKRIALRRALAALAVFIILHAAFFIALYPAMWTQPSDALDLMLERASHHATTATRPTFFDGQSELNHGLGFYPLALAYRLSPIVIVGLVLAIIFIARRLPHLDPHRRFILIALLLFSITFIVFLSPAVKKFDRYLSPAIPPLILAAAWGINQLTSRLTRQSVPSALLAHTRGSTGATVGRQAQGPARVQAAGRLANQLPTAFVLLQSLITFSAAPYLLMSYNPLLGGAAGARDRIAVGWGEGFGAAAKWVAEHDPKAAIVTGGVANVTPLFDGRSYPMTDAGWASSDYTVFTISEAQLNASLLDVMARRGRLAHVVQVGGIDAAWVFTTGQSAPQADWIRSRYRPGDVVLLDAQTPLAGSLGSIPAGVLPIDATPERISSALDNLRDQSRIMYVSTAAASPIVRRNVLTWLDANAERIEESTVAGATIGIYTPAARSTQPLAPFTVQADGTLALIGIEPLAETAAYPDRIPIATRWRVLAPPTSNYSVTLELTDANGDTWGQAGGPLRNAGDLLPPDWKPGEVVDQLFYFPVPPIIAPGEYRLRFGLDKSDGNRLGLVSASGAFSGTAPILAAIRIDPAQQFIDPETLSMRQRIDHTWLGQARLIGIDLLTYVPATGDQFLIAAYWQSLRDDLDPATEVRWFVEPESATGARSFEWRTPLVPNAQARLRSGDVLGARHSVRLPLDLPDGRYRLKIALGADAFDVTHIDVLHHNRIFDRPAGAAPVGSIDGFEVYLVEPVTPRARAGDSIQVKLAMQATQEVNVNYNVFVHLIDSTDRVAAQVDAWPQGGVWPTANWVKGQVVEDAYTLALPPDAAPGTYRIAIGMYDPLDGTRPPVRDADGRATPEGRLILDTTIQVTAP